MHQIQEKCDAVTVLLLTIFLFLSIHFLNGCESFFSAGRMGMLLTILVLVIVTPIGSILITLAVTSQFFAWLAGLILRRTPLTLAFEAFAGLVSGILMSLYVVETNGYTTIGFFFLAVVWLAVLRTARMRFDYGFFTSLLASGTSRALMYENTKPGLVTLMAVLVSCFIVYMRAVSEAKDGPL